MYSMQSRGLASVLSSSVIIFILNTGRLTSMRIINRTQSASKSVKFHAIANELLHGTTINSSQKRAFRSRQEINFIPKSDTTSLKRDAAFKSKVTRSEKVTKTELHSFDKNEGKSTPPLR